MPDEPGLVCVGVVFPDNAFQYTSASSMRKGTSPSYFAGAKPRLSRGGSAHHGQHRHDLARSSDDVIEPERAKADPRFQRGGDGSGRRAIASRGAASGPRPQGHQRPLADLASGGATGLPEDKGRAHREAICKVGERSRSTGMLLLKL